MKPRSPLVVAAVVAALAVAGCAPGGRGALPGSAERVAYYSAQVRKSPRHYPAHAQLGEAYLDQARETLAPAAIGRARAALERSLAIQVNFEALKGMAALCDFTHRFGDAAEWGARAAAAWPADTEVTALQVEAYVGMGERDAAAAILESAHPPEGEDFHLAAARGLWLADGARAAEAADAFVRAAELARVARVDELVVWAQVSAAGVWLDHGDPARAAPFLRDAARSRRDDRRLAIHRAELLVADGDLAAAAALYRSLLSRADDPEIHRRLALIARDRGREDERVRHFAAAERGFRRVLDAGEIYTLEALARLYLDHRVHLAEAAALSARNLRYKRDRRALATDREVRAAVTASVETPEREVSG